MDRVMHYQTESARRTATDAYNMGDRFQYIAKLLMGVLSTGVLIGLVVVYNINTEEETYGGNSTDWAAIVPMWSALIGAWITYVFLLAMIMMFSAQLKTQADLLEIQIAQIPGSNDYRQDANGNPNV